MSQELDQVTKSNSWELLQLGDDEMSQVYQFDKLEDTGTLVIWEECDRLQGDKVANNDKYILHKFEDAE